MAPADFNGSWKEETVENMDGFLDAIGVPADKRSSDRSKEPQVVVQDGDNFEWTSTRAGKTDTLKVVADGSSQALPWGPKTNEGTVGWEGAVLVVTMVIKDGVTVRTTREVKGNQMVMKMTAADQTATIHYKRV